MLIVATFLAMLIYLGSPVEGREKILGFGMPGNRTVKSTLDDMSDQPL